MIPTATANELSKGPGGFRRATVAAGCPARSVFNEAAKRVMMAKNGFVRQCDIAFVLSEDSAFALAASEEFRCYVRSDTIQIAILRGTLLISEDRCGLPDRMWGYAIEVDRTLADGEVYVIDACTREAFFRITGCTEESADVPHVVAAL